MLSDVGQYSLSGIVHKMQSSVAILTLIDCSSRGASKLRRHQCEVCPREGLNALLTAIGTQSISGANLMQKMPSLVLLPD